MVNVVVFSKEIHAKMPLPESAAAASTLLFKSVCLKLERLSGKANGVNLEGV